MAGGCYLNSLLIWFGHRTPILCLKCPGFKDVNSIATRVNQCSLELGNKREKIFCLNVVRQVEWLNSMRNDVESAFKMRGKAGCVCRAQNHFGPRHECWIHLEVCILQICILQTKASPVAKTTFSILLQVFCLVGDSHPGR